MLDKTTNQRSGGFDPLEDQRRFEARLADIAAKRAAETEDERWERYARQDLALVDRLSKLTPLQLQDKERQRQGEYTSEAATFDQRREEEGHH